MIAVGDSEQITKLGTHTTTLRCEYNDDLSPVEIAYQLAWTTSCLPTIRKYRAPEARLSVLNSTDEPITSGLSVTDPESMPSAVITSWKPTSRY